ncbi:MAG: prepilin peptidase [Candidatus Eremiobacteraeota bacterium]|nr:prepilin peptidase [Candidatus Eremiobacteraeota bacterium]
MTQPFWVLALCWIVFAGQAYLIVRFSERFMRPRHNAMPNAPAGDAAPYAPTDDRVLGGLAAATGFVGVWHFAHGAPLLGLVLLAAVCTTLDFACCSDLRTRRVPAMLTIPAMLVIGAVDIAGGNWPAVLAGLAIMLPFALAALKSKGRSAGFGDVALVGLGGFALGLELGILAIAAACFTAAGVGLARKRRGDTLPFAPYLALAVQAALFLPALH